MRIDNQRRTTAQKPVVPASSRATHEAAEERRRLALMGAIGGVFLMGIGMYVAMSTRPHRLSSAPVSAPAPESAVPPDALALADQREVMESGAPAILLVVKNVSDQPIGAPSAQVIFFEGATIIGTTRETSQAGFLAPNDSTTLVVTMVPANKTRFEVAIEPPRRAVVAPSPAMPLEIARLMAYHGELTFGARLTNTTGKAIASAVIYIVGYDEAGAIAASGVASVTSAVAPGTTVTTTTRLNRYNDKPVVTWEHRLDFSEDYITWHVTPDRTVRVGSAPEIVNDGFTVNAEQLATGSRFDSKLLEMTRPVAGTNYEETRVYLADLVNLSTDAIAVAPDVLVNGHDAISSLPFLYPGERLPLSLSLAATGLKVEFAPMKSLPLPGTRPALAVNVVSTKLGPRKITVEHYRDYTFPAVHVTGNVRNNGAAVARDVKLWVSSRDAKGSLTGFHMVELGSLAPGEARPFETHIEQLRAGYAQVETLYETN